MSLPIRCSPDPLAPARRSLRVAAAALVSTLILAGCGSAPKGPTDLELAESTIREAMAKGEVKGWRWR